MSEIVILNRDERALMKLGVAFQGTPYKITLAQPIRTLRTAMRLAQSGPAAIVMSLEGRENIAEIRALLDVSPDTRFLFLVPHMPPSAALSRVVRTSGSATLGAGESPIVVVATLIALLTQDRAPEHGGVT